MSDASEEIVPYTEVEGTAVVVGSADEDDASGHQEIPEALPVLPLKNTVLFPHLLTPLLISSTRSKALIDEVLLTPQRLLVCVGVRRPVEGSPATGDLYRVGTVMRIAKMLKFADDTYRLLVQGIARVAVDELPQTSPFFRGRIRPLEEFGDPESVETAALMRNVSQQFASLVAESSRLSDELQTTPMAGLDKKLQGWPHRVINFVLAPELPEFPEFPSKKNPKFLEKIRPFQQATNQ